MSIQSAAQAFHRAAQNFSASLLPGTITLGGRSYPAAVVNGSLHWQLTDGGFKILQRLACTIDKSALPTQPNLGDSALYNGSNYKITEIGNASPTQTAWLLHATRSPAPGERP